jgi:Alkylmercury lyase
MSRAEDETRQPASAAKSCGTCSAENPAIKVESRDPVSGDQIRATVTPEATVESSPEPAVVVAGAIRSHGDACGGCCPVLNFFASPANAERWLA